MRGDWRVVYEFIYPDVLKIYHSGGYVFVAYIQNSHLFSPNDGGFALRTYLFDSPEL